LLLVLAELPAEVVAILVVAGPRARLVAGAGLLGGVRRPVGLCGDPDRDRSAERPDRAGGDHALACPRRTPDLMVTINGWV
jgi:hypothetical protein